jgi:hypothetical protein
VPTTHFPGGHSSLCCYACVAVLPATQRQHLSSVSDPAVMCGGVWGRGSIRMSCAVQRTQCQSSGATQAWRASPAGGRCQAQQQASAVVGV